MAPHLFQFSTERINTVKKKFFADPFFPQFFVSENETEKYIKNEIKSFDLIFKYDIPNMYPKNKMNPLRSDEKV